ncbi:hypothetical protein CYY_007459 [Polysphondylium violaceum]|uniref:Nuclear nucleic acid-binding protein C1D n=1 Tax=Polysphondylium violaceum TaxID=133409 RepID=A0A8J4PQY2_9MYCE|nr:hypothetical protein CYY_007459 [Polysphondylium violaceum]
MTDQVLPSDIQQDITNFENILDKLEGQLDPFFKVSLKEHQEKLTPVESAKLNITVAYALNSLFFMYLQTQGVSPHDHQVKNELERIKPYILKLKSMTNKTEEKPKMQIDSDAAKRMIDNTLAMNKKIDSTVSSDNSSSSQKKRKK